MQEGMYDFQADVFKVLANPARIKILWIRDPRVFQYWLLTPWRKFPELAAGAVNAAAILPFSSW